MDEFDYPLPEAAVAQVPAEPRSAARLLVATDPDGTLSHRVVADLPELVEPGDLLVVNETRVVPGRLHLHKVTGAEIEVLLVEDRGGGQWEALVRPGRRVGPGTVLLAGGKPVVEVGERLADGRRSVRVVGDLDGLGTLPLPPYIRQPLADPERYQTVYARTPGSVAAPTAGLHLTTEVLAGLRARGVGVATVDLTVGLDTFRPITTARLEDHVMHSERFAVPTATLEACRKARRVVAVGTTTVRALETAAAGERSGRTNLFIRPGYQFRLVDVLLTNFHMPRSSLLVLLAAFGGDRWRGLYDTAVAEGYRFLSFGDAMLISRAQAG